MQHALIAVPVRPAVRSGTWPRLSVAGLAAIVLAAFTAAAGALIRLDQDETICPPAAATGSTGPAGSTTGPAGFPEPDCFPQPSPQPGPSPVPPAEVNQ